MSQIDCEQEGYTWLTVDVGSKEECEEHVGTYLACFGFFNVFIPPLVTFSFLSFLYLYYKGPPKTVGCKGRL
jgi:hypothetical protein